MSSIDITIDRLTQSITRIVECTGMATRYMDGILGHESPSSATEQKIVSGPPSTVFQALHMLETEIQALYTQLSRAENDASPAAPSAAAGRNFR